MTRRTAAKAAIVAVAALAVMGAGWGAAWAWTMHRVQFWITAAIAAVLALAVWLYYRLAPGGHHAGKGTSRDEETEALFAGMSRPAEVASEPPAELLAAPVAAGPRDLPAWAVQDGDSPAPVPYGVTHDEYGPTQRWHRAPVTIIRCSLTPVTRPAILAIAALTAPVRAHLDAAERARAEAWAAEVRETSPWEHDTSWFRLDAMDAELARAAMEQAGEVA